jgi:hypothetical protein
MLPLRAPAGHLIEHLQSDAEMMSFRAVIPPMLDALRQMMTGDDEDAVNSAFEVWDGDHWVGWMVGWMGALAQE